MKKMFFPSYTPNRPSRAIRREDEPVVKNGLAVTPSEMERMLAAGVPIRSQLIANFADDPVADNNFEVPIHEHRGIDAAEVYEASMDAKKKIVDYFKRAPRVQEGGE